MFYWVSDGFISDLNDLGVSIAKMGQELNLTPTIKMINHQLNFNETGYHIINFPYIIYDYIGIDNPYSYFYRNFGRSDDGISLAGQILVTDDFIQLYEEELTKIANCLRDITGTTEQLSLEQMNYMIKSLQKRPSNDCLTLVATKPNSYVRLNLYDMVGITPDTNIQYRINEDEEWKTYNINNSVGERIDLPYKGSWVQFQNLTNTFSVSGAYYYFSINGEIKTSGDISSLLNYKKDYCPAYSLQRLFQGCNNLVSAKDLILPFEAIEEECFAGMFENCGIVDAPELHWTTLAPYCYCYMFFGCSKLNYHQDILPATTLETGCYYFMYYGSGIIEAPILPAKNLVDSCYRYMFYNCGNLRKITALFETNWSPIYTEAWVGRIENTGGSFYCTQRSFESFEYGQDCIPQGWNVYISGKDFIYLRPHGSNLNYDFYLLNNDKYGKDAIYKYCNPMFPNFNRYFIYYQGMWRIVDEVKEEYNPSFDYYDNGENGFDYFVPGDNVLEITGDSAYNGKYCINRNYYNESQGTAGYAPMDADKCSFIRNDVDESRLRIEYVGDLIFADGDVPPALLNENSYNITYNNNYYGYTHENLMNFLTYQDKTIKYPVIDYTDSVIEISYIAEPKFIKESPYF